MNRPHVLKPKLGAATSTLALGWSLNSARPAAAAAGLPQALVGPLFDPLMPGEPESLRAFVWNDFRLAVLFNVLMPLALWIWSLRAQTGKDDAIKRIMFGYWQAASLLMWTVYLQIGAQPVGFFTALLVQALIPVSVWWWQDLNQEVERDNSALKKAFVAWRYIVTGLGAIGVAAQVTQTQAPCTLAKDSATLLSRPECTTWLEPPIRYKALLHGSLPADKLQYIGIAGASIFAAYFIYYVLVTVPKTGRQARRNVSLSYKVLRRMGFYQS
jgi:hypothetical protein